MAERRNAQHHDLHSFADTFLCPQSQLAPPQGAKPLDAHAPDAPPRKAKRRRKRHAPPGPAGVWFQSQLHNNTDSTSSQHPRKQQEVAAADVSSCPAWMCMQHSLNLCTPYLPPYLSVHQRYRELRPYIPSEYLLLPEVKGSSLLLEDKKLLVLVHAAVVLYHSYWTLELKDECGSQISAWMDPQFDEERDGGLLQIGVVWCLRDLRILVSETKQQWLLISRNNIERAWTPHQASKEFSDVQYIEWMTRRSHMRSIDDRQQSLLEEAHEEERQTRVQEEEEDDDVVIPKGFAARVVAPHPSMSNRKCDATNVSQSNPSVLQEICTEPTSASGHGDLLMRKEPKDTLPRPGVATFEREEPMNRPAVSANVFSQFRSSSSDVAAASDAPRHREPVSRNTQPVANPNASANCHRTKNVHEISSLGNDSSLSSKMVTTAIIEYPAGPHSTTGSVLHAQSEPGNTNSVNALSQFSAMGAQDVTFSQFRSPTSATAEFHAENPYQRPRSEESPRRNSLEGSQQPVRMAYSSVSDADDTKQNCPSRSNDAIEKTSLVAHATSKSSSSSINSNISSVLSQFAAVPVRNATGGTTSTVVNGAIGNGTSLKVAKRSMSQSPKKRNKEMSDQQQSKKKPQLSPKTKSPKLLSKLWLDADMSMMGMLDEDGDDNVCSQSLPTVPRLAAHVPEENDSPTESSNPEASSLFQASAFAGISVDDLFNEEDD